ncbi:MAG TPA: sigma-70 family RNA polymerase sigma factor [Kofleriaceae bacterium]|jgi:RNA polymerase sigma-70 factor (ECF subfamily)
MTLAARLADRMGQTLSSPALAALDAHLEAASTETRAKYPALAMEDDIWLDALADRIDTDLPEAITPLALADIYLVGACLANRPPALAALERVVRSEATRATARLGSAARTPVEDLVQELLLKLVVGDARKLAGFSGHGSLEAWLRIAAIRTAISLGRKRQEHAIDGEELEALADDGDDQALAFLKSSYREQFKRAFSEALAALPKRSRTLLRLQINDQLTIEEIGAFYSVSRATGARWLADARTELVTGTRKLLSTALGLPADELAQLMQLVASNLYATLPRLLRHTNS